MTPNLYFNWLFGPQVLGLLYLLIGSIQHYFPPKKINNWYGYRTQISQSSQAAWDEAQQFSAVYTIRIGVMVVVLGLLATTGINLIPMELKAKQVLTIFFFMVSGMAPPLFMIVKTEKHMAKFFGDK